MHPCKKGKIEMLQNLLRHGADINQITKNLETALSTLCKSPWQEDKNNFGGYEETMQFLLRAGADTNHRDRGEDTPLLNLLKAGIPDGMSLQKIWRMFLENGMDISSDEMVGPRILSILLEQREKLHPEWDEVFEEVFKAGISPHWFEKEGRTIGLDLITGQMSKFTYGLYHRNKDGQDENIRRRLHEIFRVMIAAGLNVNQEDEHGATVMTYAWVIMEPGTVASLQENGASLDCTIPSRVLTGVIPPSARELVRKPTLLHLACFRNAVAAVSYLLHHGALMTPLDQGMTPLSLNLKVNVNMDIFLHFIWHGYPIFNDKFAFTQVCNILSEETGINNFVPLLVAAGYKSHHSSLDEESNAGDSASSQELSIEGSILQKHYNIFREQNLKRFRRNITPAEESQTEKNVHETLHKQALTNQTLKHTCRVFIRQNLYESSKERSILQNTEQLTERFLPKPLMRYLLLENELEEVGFHKIPKDQLPSLQEQRDFYTSTPLSYG